MSIYLKPGSKEGQVSLTLYCNKLIIQIKSSLWSESDFSAKFWR